MIIDPKEGEEITESQSWEAESQSYDPDDPPEFDPNEMMAPRFDSGDIDSQNFTIDANED